MYQKKFLLSEIARYLDLEVLGDPNCEIVGVDSLDHAKAEQITFLERASMRKLLATTKASAVILPEKFADLYAGNKLIADNPQVAFAKVTRLFYDMPPRKPGIHKTAVIGDDCAIHPSVAIGANCTIGNNVIIGENTIIEPGCVLSDNVVLGSNCLLYSNVSIYHRVFIGNRVIIHSGAVVGADGFGMANDNGKWCKIFQLGSVRIGDDVEIGANTCVDRGALDDTVISEDVKLDNQIQIGHNVKIGAHTVIAGCTGIAGSTKVGDYCMIGGAVSLADHLTVTDQVIITGASTVGRDIPESGIYTSAVTVQPHRVWGRILSNLIKLPNIIKSIKNEEGNE